MTELQNGKNMTENGIHPETNTISTEELLARLKRIEDSKYDAKKEIIDLKISSIDQFYNPLDPAPRSEKELNPKVEEYILTPADDLRLRQEWVLAVYLPQNEINPHQEEALKRSVHTHFIRRADGLKKQARKKTNQIILNTVFGFLFLGLCLTAAYGMTTLSQGSDFYEILGQGLTVVGWVALWNPVEYLLYDRWGPRKEIAVSKKLGKIDIEIIPYPEKTAEG